MIDLHCHIIPGVDDGAQDMDTSISMARMSVREQTGIIAATSHFNRPDQPVDMTPNDILSGLRSFKSTLERENIPLRVVQGMELFATPDLPDILNRNQYLTLNGSKYLLVEFYFDERRSFMEWCFDEIRSRGLVPVIVHPERYETVQRRPLAMGDWFSRGLVIQLNKGSILGDLGEHAEDAAWWALERGLAHVVSSDAHSTGGRSPGLEQVNRLLRLELSDDYAELLTEGNPRRILRNLSPALSL